MNKQSSFSEKEALVFLTKIYKDTGLLIGKAFDKEHLIVIYENAKEEIDSGKYTWEMFLKGFKQAGKKNSYFPTFNKIEEQITNIYGALEDDVNSQAERDYQYFKDNMNNDRRYQAMPNWVFTIRELIGRDRCMNITYDEEVWFKKDYKEVYADVREGKYELRDIPMQFIKRDRLTLLSSNVPNYDKKGFLPLNSQDDWKPIRGHARDGQKQIGANDGK